MLVILNTDWWMQAHPMKCGLFALVSQRTVGIAWDFHVVADAVERLLSEDLRVEAGVVKADPAVLIHVLGQAALQGGHRMSQAVVQLAQVELLDQAHDPASGHKMKEGWGSLHSFS